MSDTEEAKHEPEVYEENEVLKDTHEKQSAGVCYMSTVPPYMTPFQLKKLLVKHFNIGRIFMQSEDEFRRIQRAKQGGNRKTKYTEAWVEFEKKSEAKQCALLLNGQKIGGKKRHNLFYDDLWHFRYLSKFKWANLTEKLAYDQKMRQQRLQNELSKAKKEITFYQEKKDLGKRLDKMEEKKQKKIEKELAIQEKSGNDEDKERIKKKKANNLAKQLKYHQRKRRVFKQREPLQME